MLRRSRLRSLLRRSAGKSNKFGKQCEVGQLVEGRWKHIYTIGRESHKEFKSTSVSRAKAKIALPEEESKELLEVAWKDWQATQQSKRSKNNREDEE